MFFIITILGAVISDFKGQTQGIWANIAMDAIPNSWPWDVGKTKTWQIRSRCHTIHMICGLINQCITYYSMLCASICKYIRTSRKCTEVTISIYTYIQYVLQKSYFRPKSPSAPRVPNIPLKAPGTAIGYLYGYLRHQRYPYVPIIATVCHGGTHWNPDSWGTWTCLISPGSQRGKTICSIDVSTIRCLTAQYIPGRSWKWHITIIPQEHTIKTQQKHRNPPSYLLSSHSEFRRKPSLSHRTYHRKHLVV